MDLVVEHLLVEVHRCLSSFFPTRFSGWPTSSTAGMMPSYGAQGELRRIPLPRHWVNKGLLLASGEKSHGPHRTITPYVCMLNMGCGLGAGNDSSFLYCFR